MHFSFAISTLSIFDRVFRALTGNLGNYMIPPINGDFLIGSKNPTGKISSLFEANYRKHSDSGRHIPVLWLTFSDAIATKTAQNNQDYTSIGELKTFHWEESEVYPGLYCNTHKGECKFNIN